MKLARFVLLYKHWNEKTTDFLNTTIGRRLRISVLGGTIVVYPLVSLITNGPLVNLSFPYRYHVEDLPISLKQYAEEEYARFREKEARLSRDAVVTYHIAKNAGETDTIASGSLGVRTGLHVALPFFTKFKTIEDALGYFKRGNSNYIDYLGHKLYVDWNTPKGEELAASYVMSENAIRFIMLRDLYAHDGYSALAQRSISWSTWTSFTSIFTYWIHKSARICGGTAMSFITTYSLFITAAWFANKHWHYLYRFITDIHADSVAARSSFAHSEGGKEFYWKQLKRNRIFRDMHPSLHSLITLSGDVRGIPTSILMRYDHLKDVNEEDDELKVVVDGDD